MKYFLRKSKLKRGEYLQIYKSEYIRGVGSMNIRKQEHRCVAD